MGTILRASCTLNLSLTFAYHHFVQNRPSAVVHLVKLVNAANPVVTEYQGTTEMYEKKPVKK